MPQKLTRKQQEVIQWIDGGWTLIQTRGMVIEVNGKRICNRDTINALVKKGLVIESERWHFKKKSD